MSAEQALGDGRVDDALAELQDQVRKAPADPKHRVFLFQLLALLGQWDRALTQLNVAADLDPATLAMAQTYREALRCEVLRGQVFAGRRSPLIFGDPQQWIALTLEALRLTAQGEHAHAQEVREQAFESAPTTTGSIDEQAFDWIADADSRLGPMLEAIVNGRYYWVPFDRISQIHIEPPEDLRDMVWMPAYFTWANGGETVGLIPTRYPGSESSDDANVRMARRTEWIEHPGNAYLGSGQRMLATSETEYPLMEIRAISLDTVTEEDGESSAGQSEQT